MVFQKTGKIEVHCGSTESYDYYLLFCMITKGAYGTTRCERASKLLEFPFFHLLAAEKNQITGVNCIDKECVECKSAATITAKLLLEIVE